MTMIKAILLLAAMSAAVPGLAQPVAEGGAVPAALDVAAAKARIDAMLDTSYPHLDALYKDIHAHPELGFRETRTAALLASEMRRLGFTVTEHVGGTGIVAIYSNGVGPTVLVRTELDALPMEEKTGLPYASRVQTSLSGPPRIALTPDGQGNRVPKALIEGATTFVAHSCGHDAHMAWWVGTAATLVAMKDRWHGTLVFVGQPAEEIASGAKAMLADGLFTRFPKPDYGFAAHVGPGALGTVTIKDGVVTSASDAIAITFHGVGAHGSTPDRSIDPIMEAVHFANDVQTVISRQKDPQKFGVLGIGAFNAGTAGNVIPDHADLKLTLRSFDPEVRKLLNDSVTLTANAAATMAHAPAPDVTHVSGNSSVINDGVLVGRTTAVLRSAFGADSVDFQPAYKPGGAASEDYSEYAVAGMTKSVFFVVGGLDPRMIAEYKAAGRPIPVNHSPYFAPVPEPTIRRGVETLTLAVLTVAAR